MTWAQVRRYGLGLVDMTLMEQTLTGLRHMILELWKIQEGWYLYNLKGPFRSTYGDWSGQQTEQWSVVTLWIWQTKTNGDWGTDRDGKAIQTILEAKPHKRPISRPRDRVDIMERNPMLEKGPLTGWLSLGGWHVVNSGNTDHYGSDAKGSSWIGWAPLRGMELTLWEWVPHWVSGWCEGDTMKMPIFNNKDTLNHELIGYDTLMQWLSSEIKLRSTTVTVQDETI